MGRELTEEDKSLVAEMLNRANAAMSEVEDYSQEQLDRLAQAIVSFPAYQPIACARRSTRKNN